MIEKFIGLTFNRTTVECKFLGKLTLAFSGISFNRTTVECKCD